MKVKTKKTSMNDLKNNNKNHERTLRICIISTQKKIRIK